MKWYDMILYFIFLSYPHRRLHVQLDVSFLQLVHLGASWRVTARWTRVSEGRCLCVVSSSWRGTRRVCRTAVDGVQRSKDGIWWHGVEGWRVPVWHSFARGSMSCLNGPLQTSMLVPRRPIFFFSRNLPDMRLKSCNFTEKHEISTSRLLLGSFVRMVSHGPIVLDCDLWGDGVPAAPRHIGFEVDGYWSYWCVFLFCVRR